MKKLASRDRGAWLRSRIIMAACASFLFQTVSALATIYYVSPTGSDSNNGAPSHPLATIMKAESLCASGDTISLDDGTYSVGSTIAAYEDGSVYAAVNVINVSGIKIVATSGLRCSISRR
ncbi:MAG: hypothetical protein QM796_16005 [Chthoniobacteraceae bacterium]